MQDGRFTLTGEITAYFESPVLYEMVAKEHARQRNVFRRYARILQRFPRARIRIISW